MKLLDFVKAVGLAVLILALNLLITSACVFVYARTLDRGHDFAYYTPVAMRIAAWSAPAGAAVLLFAATYLLGRRRPRRNAFAFGVAIWAVYLVIDVASAWPNLAAAFATPMIISMALGLAGAISGAVLASRNRSQSRA